MVEISFFSYLETNVRWIYLKRVSVINIIDSLLFEFLLVTIYFGKKILIKLQWNTQ